MMMMCINCRFPGGQWLSICMHGDHVHAHQIDDEWIRTDNDKADWAPFSTIAEVGIKERQKHPQPT